MTDINAWRPSASLDILALRAATLKKIRDFFQERKILEVETPLLAHTSVTDPFIESMPTLFKSLSQEKYKTYYLQTSPEYYMKRLLAAGSGSIFQISKAFRQGEVGRLHNPEFSMLEWYRIGFNHHQLMQEMDEFLQSILKSKSAEKISYAQAFQHFLQLDIHTVDIKILKSTAMECGINLQKEINECASLLDLLMSTVIEPQLGLSRPCFIYDFPASHAALAKLNPSTPKTAARFEVYVEGIELANGFHELQDAQEQHLRFENNLAERKRLGLNQLDIDAFFLSALNHGLPDCAGVALGIDRLLMLITESKTISEVLSFDFSRV